MRWNRFVLVLLVCSVPYPALAKHQDVAQRTTHKVPERYQDDVNVEGSVKPLHTQNLEKIGKNDGSQELLQRLGYTRTLVEHPRTAASSDEKTLWQQKFILDVLININGELLNEHLIALGDALVVDETRFDHIDDVMLHLLQLCVQGSMLKKTDKLDLLNPQHLAQMVGLYRLMIHAKSWTTFQRVVCFARQHLNGVLVTNALALALRERVDSRHLVMPAFNQVLPSLFYDDALVQHVQRTVDLNSLLGAGEHTQLSGGGGKKTWQQWRAEKVLKMNNQDWTDSQMEWTYGGAEKLKKEKSTTQQPNFMSGGIPKIVVTMPENEATNEPDQSLDERIAYLTSDMSLANLWYAIHIRNAIYVGENAMDKNNWDINRKINAEEIQSRLKQSTKQASQSPTDAVSSEETVENAKESSNDHRESAANSRLLYVSRRRLNKTPANNLANLLTGHHNPVSTGDNDSDEELVATISSEEDNAQATGRTRVSYKMHTVSLDEGGTSSDIRYLRSGEMFMHNFQQMWARLNLEKISHLAEEMLERDDNKSKKSKKPANSQERNIDLVRVLNERDGVSDAAIAQVLQVIQLQLHDRLLQKLNELIELREKDQLHLVSGRVRELIGAILLGHHISDVPSTNIDAVALWRGIESVLNDAMIEGGFVLTELERHMVTPTIRRIVELVVRITESIVERLPPYTQKQVMLDGVHLNEVIVDRLQTYWDTVDDDLINMLPRLDEQLRRTDDIAMSQKMLVARQRRLNHNAFNIQLNLTADREQDVVVRLLLGPQLDVATDLMNLNDIRQHYLLIDAFGATLKAGNNVLQRNSRDILLTSRDVTPFTVLYKNILLGIDGEKPVLIDTLRSRNCRIANRLLLPRGLKEGLQLQLLAVVTARSADDLALERKLPDELVCGMGMSTINLDSRPFNFPFDRRIDNLDGLVSLPNILLKNVLIYHNN